MAKSLQRIRHATPAQLRRAADLDLWRGGASGLDARFDADRFNEWLEALVEAGSDVTARQIASLDIELVVVGIAEHVRVFDGAVRTADPSRDESAIGGYVVVPRRDRVPQAVLDTLASLHEEDPAHFHRVMRACRRLSNEGFERDGLHDLLSDREQAMFDLAIARERRREQQGFVTAADARAFLAAPTEGRRALFRAHVRDTGVAALGVGEPPVPEPPDVFDENEPTPARALLGAAPIEPQRVSRLQTLVRTVCERDTAAAAMRAQELGFLGNIVAAGCSVQGRSITPEEASEAVAAACDFALENRPNVPDAFLVDSDVLTLFDEGWARYRHVCLDTSDRLIETLTQIRCHDRAIQNGLDDLRLALTRHRRDGMPWRARQALDVITQLDLPAWAALVGLIAECPVVHAAVRAIVERHRGAIDPHAFAFIAESRQIATVRQFLVRLPDILTGV